MTLSADDDVSGSISNEPQRSIFTTEMYFQPENGEMAVQRQRQTTKEKPDDHARQRRHHKGRMTGLPNTDRRQT